MIEKLKGVKAEANDVTGIAKKVVIKSLVHNKDKTSTKRNPQAPPQPTKGDRVPQKTDPRGKGKIPTKTESSSAKGKSSGIQKWDMPHYPEVISQFADVLPHDPITYSIMEEKIKRGDVDSILYLCSIDGKLTLLHDHMMLDIIIKMDLKNFHYMTIDSVKSIEEGVWWIVEHCNSQPHYTLFTRIEIMLNALPHYKKLAKENRQLAGKHKKELNQVCPNYQPIDCLKIIAQKSKVCKQTVSDVRFIKNHGTPEEIEKCRKGIVKIGTMQKNVKERRAKSKDYQKKNNAANDDVAFKNPKDGKFVNKITNGDALDTLKEMEFNGIKNVACMMTSPPYNVSLDYGPGCDDNIDYQEYLDYLARVIYQAQKLGRDGMRICINCALIVNKQNANSGDFKFSVMADLINKVQELNRQHDDCNLRFWGHFNWYKKNNGGRVCQGSISCKSPILRPDSEYIAIWVKNTNKLENIHGYDATIEPEADGLLSTSDKHKYIITPEEYYKYTLQTWAISPACGTKHRHPAKFPEEIPYRVCKLFTYPQDLIIDPYCGSGTTCVVAKKLKRNFIGVDQNPAFCDMAQNRCDEVK